MKNDKTICKTFIKKCTGFALKSRAASVFRTSIQLPILIEHWKIAKSTKEVCFSKILKIGCTRKLNSNEFKICFTSKKFRYCNEYS